MERDGSDNDVPDLGSVDPRSGFENVDSHVDLVFPEMRSGTRRALLYISYAAQAYDSFTVFLRTVTIKETGRSRHANRTSESSLIINRDSGIEARLIHMA